MQASSSSQQPSETKNDAQPASQRQVVPKKLGIASQCMVLAVAMAGLRDGLLSRDAATIAAHVLLMSTEALREEDTAVLGSGSQDELLVKERWRRVRGQEFRGMLSGSEQAIGKGLVELAHKSLEK